MPSAISRTVSARVSNHLADKLGDAAVAANCTVSELLANMIGRELRRPHERKIPDRRFPVEALAQLAALRSDLAKLGNLEKYALKMGRPLSTDETEKRLDIYDAIKATLASILE